MKKIISMTRDRQVPKIHGRLWMAVQEKLNVERKKQKLELLTAAQLGNLPGDLVCMIFLLLPADSVHIASLVCKGWFELIKCSYFVEIYNRKFDNVLVFLQTIQERRPKTFCFEPHSTFLFERRQQSKMTYINFLEIQEGKGKVIESNVGGLNGILATCNGLILGTCEHKLGLVVVNPATKKHISFPLGTTLPRLGESYGLVFSHSTGDYKVVHLFNEKNADTCCEIFSLSKKSWHAVDGPSPGIRIFADNPVEAFGSLHWLPRVYATRTVSMGVDEETFFTIDLPTTSQAEDRLVEIGGCLAFVGREVRRDTIDIWMLSGLEGEDWEKKHTITCTGKSLREVYLPVCTFCFGRQLVFHGRRSSFYSYDLETKETRMVEMEDGTRNPYKLWPHRNTLASWDSRDVLR